MAYDFQVVIDCSDPHVFADWWGQAMGWDVEPQDQAFIDEMIGKGLATEDDTTLHNGSKVWKDGAAIRHPDLPAGSAPRRILFQLVPEVKTVKNRVHVDIWVGPENVETEQSSAREPRGHLSPHRVTGSPFLGHDGRPGGQRVLHRLNSGPLDHRRRFDGTRTVDANMRRLWVRTPRGGATGCIRV